MKRPSLAAALYLIIVFASGAVVGTFGHHLYTSKTVSAKVVKTPEEYRRSYIGEMRSRLHLNDSQVATLNSILDVTRNRYREMRERNKPEMKAIESDQVGQIRAILDDAQKAEYQKMREEREQRRKSEGRSGGGC